MLPTFSSTSVVPASPHSPNKLMATTSHHHNLRRTSGSSSNASVSGSNRLQPGVSRSQRRIGPSTDYGTSLMSTMSSLPLPKPHILGLATEQLLAILDYLEDDPQKSIGFDRRAYLSQESFRPPPPPSATRAQDLGNWRRTCKKFAEIGASLLFARVSTRFSVNDLDRLDKIASRPHLAGEVRKFSYFVPYFYVDGRDRVQEVLPSLNESLGRLDFRHYQVKIREQQTILRTGKDQQTLLKALKAFKKLQHIQILPTLDVQDRQLLSWLQENVHVRQYLELNWPTACSHSTKTIGEALIMSKSHCSRFSSPSFEPRSAMSLARLGIFGPLVSKLTTIELHFGDGTEDLDFLMQELAPMLRAVFKAAPDLQGIHMGFPSSRPIALPLEDIFHGVAWPKLLCFGIQGWKLHAHEIISLTTRHQRTLKGLRLRDVLLKEDSRWHDVLPHLKNNMTRLEWCSLRRIGYAAHFDEISATQGAEIPDDPLGGTSDSNDSSDAETDDAQSDDHWSDSHNDEMAPTYTLNHINGHDSHTALSTAGWTQANGYESDQDSNAPSTHSDHTDDENGLNGIQMAFPASVAPSHDRHARIDTPASLLWCNCGNQSISVDLENAGPYSDNGVEVSSRTRKMWEKWVIGRCPVHDPTPT